MDTPADKVVEALRASLKEVDRLRQQNREIVAASREPIAVIGIGCRFPGGVRSPEDLWRLLRAGNDVVSPFPGDRGWDLDALYDPDPDHKGTTYVREGGFLDDAGHFDAAFFGISPREALTIDPQQRLLLETSWEAIERAGIDPASLHGSPTGVFVGVIYHDYGARLLHLAGDLEGQLGIGSAGSVASGRIAYVLGLHGPAITVDTACSSSLVAIHLAGEALRRGECALALAGGVSIMATPTSFIELSRQRALSPGGRCKAFSADADGAGWAEGAGMLLLERLSAAKRNGRPIAALLRGSAVNQDGKSQGLTAPSGPAQERVIQQALASAGLSPADVDAVEAHGTGTPLGDPIEARALLATYGKARSEDHPLWLGSIKSNFGHAQAAAGVAGIIKMALALEHGLLPKTLHADRPSPHVDWSQGAVRLLHEPVPWPARDGGPPRRAAVSSFGISGTNAHVIVEEAPAAGIPARPDPQGAQHAVLPFLVSAKSEAALSAQAARLRDHIDPRPDVALGDLAVALAATRSRFEHRAIVVAQDRRELLDGLEALAQGAPAPRVARGSANVAGKVAFVFPGQGSQWVGMARALLDTSDVFRVSIEACARALAPHVDVPLLDVLRGTEPSASRLDRASVVQPALFSVMVALAALLRSMGVDPDAVVGHSQGEIAAACVAGALSLEDAAKVVALRSRALAKLEGRGAMAAIELPSAEVAGRIQRWGEGLSIAAVNSPRSTLVAGDPMAVDALLRELEAAHVFARKVRVDYASHSVHVAAVEGELLAGLAGITPRASITPIYSTVTGRKLDGIELDAAYWYQNLRRTVRFADAAGELLSDGHRFFVEVSPHPVLALSLHDIIHTSRHRAAVAGSLRRDEGDLRRLVLSLAELAVHGLDLDWEKLLPKGHPVPLPTYAFQRERYWLDLPERHGGDVTSAGLAAADHPLLGAAVDVAGAEEVVFTGRLSLSRHPWLAGHAALGVVLLPGTAFLDLALFAAHRAGCERIEELTLEAPLALPAKGAVDLQLSVGAPDATGRRPLTFHARPEDAPPEGPWTRHATGVLSRAPASAAFDLRAFPPAEATPLALDHLYDALARAGLTYGDAFQGLKAAWACGGDLFAEVQLPDGLSLDAARFGLHPALLDAALHALAAGAQGGAAEVALPFSWAGVSLCSAGASALRVRLSGRDRPGVVSLQIADASGEPVATIDALRTRPAAPEQFRGVAFANVPPLHTVDWVPLPEPPAQPQAGSLVLLGGEDAELAAALAPRAHLDGLAALQASLDRGERAPDVVAVAWTAAVDDDAATAHGATLEALRFLQAWLADGRLAASRLVVLTRRAIAAGPDEGSLALSHAPVWGLARTAQSEHPDRPMVLLDLDDAAPSQRVVLAATASNEPQIAVRGGALRVPRLARATALRTSPPRAFDTDGTVLITGGTGTLGGLVARRLVEQHGVRRLLLTSRKGSGADGAARLQGDLEAAGAHVTFAACDAADRGALEQLLASIPDDHPLTGVFHAAGALDDAVLSALTPEQVARVLRPKVDAALNLHELTRDLDLAAFVLFSSLAGVLGAMGQGNYAAANTFLDALAHHRRARGLAGASIAWGYWAERSAMAAHLSDVDLARMRRSGVDALSSDHGLALFDAALGRPEALVVAARFNASALSALEADALPPPLRSLAQAAQRRAAGARSPAALKQRLAQRSEADRERLVLDVVRAQIAAVLGKAAAAIEADRPLKELGLDSLMALELRNRIGAASGLRLPATLLFDHPTPSALARHLCAELTGEGPRASSSDRSRMPAGAPDEPMAIVAMSCRFPGGVHTPEQLWALIARGGDAISAIPEDRGWQVDQIYDPDPDAKGKMYVREGGFLADADDFDAAFFGISPREAVTIDPQQRMLLEISWEAIERAGIDPTSLQGSSTGVFLGVMYNDYGIRLLQAAGDLDGQIGIGSAASVASGRIAYTLGLEGPAISIDTACSSSLVAIHLACQALRRGDCALALAGGVALMATPATLIEFSRQRALAPDGRCKPFSAEADGTSWAEGAGVLLLERLSDARRRGRPILALVRGAAVNQDGRSQGLTAPNGPSQQRVIRQAIESAGLSPRDIDAVEAHGTGTSLGDPIEAQAILATYGAGRDREAPLWLGSIKGNLGHTQAAAGVAGVMKMVLSMQHGLLPKTLYADRPTPHVDWSPGTVRLLDEPVPWRSSHPRRAGVSSFGISGTNAHVILEEAPTSESTAVSAPASASASASAPAPASASAPASAPVLLPVSARTEAALRAQAERLREHLVSHPDLALADVAYSLGTTRAHFEQRAAVIARDRAAAIDALSALARGAPAPDVVEGTAVRPGKIAFVFPGQGAQWPRMALALFDASAAFRERIEACERALSPHVDWSLLDVLRGAEGAPTLDAASVVQPVLFAVMVSLAALFRSLGIEPDAVVGHSQGEIAAACVAGALSLDDAAKVVALRSRALTRLAGRGAMAAVELPAAAVAQRIERWNGLLSIAAVNSPRATVVSGEPDAVDALLRELEAEHVFARKVRVDYASHSAQVEAIQGELLSLLAGIAPRSSPLPLYSAVTGDAIDGAELDVTYWYENLRRTVRFADVVQKLASDGYSFFIEVSPHPVLTLSLHETFEAASAPAAVTGALRRDEGDLPRVLLSLAELYTQGLALDWAKLSPTCRQVELPTYAFQRRRYRPAPRTGPRDAALATPAGGGPAQGGRAQGGRAQEGPASGWAPNDAPALRASRRAGGHPLLGDGTLSADTGAWLFDTTISREALAWVSDHAVLGSALLPGVAFFELACAAAEAASHPRAAALVEAAVRAPLVVPEEGALRLQVSVTPSAPSSGAGTLEVRIYSAPLSQEPHAIAWTLHAEASFRLLEREHEPPPPPQGALPPRGLEPEPLAGFYDKLAAHGIAYGPSFRTLREACREGRGDGCTRWVRAALDEAWHEDAKRYGVHPALLDGVLQAIGLWQDDGERDIYLPFLIEGLTIWRKGASALWARVRCSRESDGTQRAEASLYDDDGAPIGRIDRLHLQRADRATLLRAGGAERHRYAIAWEDLPLGEAGLTGRWALVSDGGLHAQALRRALEDAGTEVEARLAHADAGASAPVGEARPPLVDGARPAAPGGVDGVLRLWPSQDDDAGDAVPRRAQAQLEQALSELQALLSSGSPPRRLVWVTQGAIAAGAGDAVSALSQAPLWGLARSAREEHPELRLQLLDVDAAAESTRGLVQALACEDEPEVAVRGGRAQSPRLVRARAARVDRGGTRSPAGARWPAPRTPAQALRRGGTFLLTGGTGLLGRVTARWLAEQGAAHLVLTSRRGPEAPDAAQVKAELEALGVEVTVAACDVADLEALRALFAAIAAEGQLSGVFHGAGALDDGVLRHQTPARFAAVLAPKVVGAWNLHRLTQGLALHDFVLFSSAAGVLGGAGQGSYAAANAFLDALAHHRRARGLPAVSLAWGRWADESGLTAHLDPAARARLLRVGMGALSRDEGIALLESAIGADDVVSAPMALDLRRLKLALERADQPVPPLLRTLVAERAAPSPRSAEPPRSAEALRARLRRLAGEARHAPLLDLVREEVAYELGLGAPGDIAPDRPLLELGLNSLMALEIRRRLRARLGVPVPATLLFEARTADAAAARLRRLIEPELSDPSDGAVRPHPTDERPHPTDERPHPTDERPHPMDERPHPADPRAGHADPRTGHGASGAGGAASGRGDAPVRSLGAEGSGALAALVRQAHDRGAFDLGWQLIDLASQLRRARRPGDAAESAAPVPAPVRLARGAASPVLLCIPALAVPTGPIQFARLAASLRDLRDVWVLPNPGFTAGESLPADIGSVIEHQAEAARRCAGGAPFALVGVSSGGLLAHAVASHLERLGLSPAALVLLDTYPLDKVPRRFLEAVRRAWLDYMPSIPRLDDELTAMHWYFQLFERWAPAALSTPTLFVRATEPLLGSDGAAEAPPGGDDWRARWELPHVAVEVPGDHFTMLDRHAGETARQIHAWLAALPERATPRIPTPNP